MVTNYEVDAFLTSCAMKARGPGLIKHFLLLLDDAHNPDMASARARLRTLMQRDRNREAPCHLGAVTPVALRAVGTRRRARRPGR
jgi:hypothetical protein